MGAESRKKQEHDISSVLWRNLPRPTLLPLGIHGSVWGFRVSTFHELDRKWGVERKSISNRFRFTIRLKRSNSDYVVHCFCKGASEDINLFAISSSSSVRSKHVRIWSLQKKSEIKTAINCHPAPAWEPGQPVTNSKRRWVIKSRNAFPTLMEISRMVDNLSARVVGCPIGCSMGGFAILNW